VHRLGSAHQPEAPLHPGDALHINLYWRAEVQPQGDWGLAIDLVDLEDWIWATATGEPVPGFPSGQWWAGDVWRGQFNLVLPADAAPGRYWLHIQAIPPAGSAPEPFVSEAIRIER
ncbi:MAG: hypothetical protein ACP5JJ_16385, partial [Anaerolineae bacterium]